jgi:hypothetical protein
MALYDSTQFRRKLLLYNATVPSCLQSATMSTTLQEKNYFNNKLPAELRVQIYEHALSFKRPLYHVHAMRPFVSMGDTDSDRRWLRKNLKYDKSRNPRNTNAAAILATSKYVHREAIETLFKLNTVLIPKPLLTDYYLHRRILPDTNLRLVTRITFLSERLVLSSGTRRVEVLDILIRNIASEFPVLETVMLDANGYYNS